MFSGLFKAGKLDGEGEMFQDGKVTKGTWMDNVLDESTKLV